MTGGAAWTAAMNNADQSAIPDADLFGGGGPLLASGSIDDVIRSWR